eukprot:scaffold28073_cov17-Prasinocladus_malaysianus.AAC.1
MAAFQVRCIGFGHSLGDISSIERSHQHHASPKHNQSQFGWPLRPGTAVDHVGNIPGQRPKVHGYHALRDDACCPNKSTAAMCQRASKKKGFLDFDVLVSLQCG